SEVTQHVGRVGVLARVGGEPEFEVGVDGVGPVVLQRVRPQLGEEPDAASLVPAQVQDDAAPLLPDALHGGVQLGPAVAALGVQDVAGEAFGVDAGGDV